MRGGLDLSKFKKIKEDKESATLQHPEGHQIRISKGVLSPEFKEKLSKLPTHLADGGDVSDEELAQEAKALNGPKNLAMNRPDESKRSAEGFTPEFPEPTPVQMAQAEQPKQVVINVGGQNEQAKQAQPAQEEASPSSKQPDYFTNGTFDFNKFIVHSPEAPLDAKMKALKALDLEEKQKQGMAQGEANNLSQQAADASAYNQRAAQMGLPPVQVPNAPVMPNAMADAGNMQPSQMNQAAMPQMQPQAPQDPYGTTAYSDTMNRGISDVKSGIEAGAQAESNLGQQQAGLYHNQANQQQQILSNYNDQISQLNNEIKSVAHDYREGHLDANRFMNSMGTGQRIMTGIGLILGGMGGGLTHQENPALKYLNAQIDRDIESQKAELGKNDNLLSAYMRQFGNLKDATQMATVVNTEMLKNQISEQAAKSQDPISKARAQQAIGELDMKNAGILSQIAMRRSLAGSAGGDPSTKLRMLTMSGIIPEGQQAGAYKELNEAMDTTHAKDNILSAFDQLQKINTLGGAISSPFQTPKQVDAIKKPIVAALSKGTAGRFTEADAGYLESIFPAKGDSPETIALKKNRLDKLISEKMNFPILQSYGISLGNSPRETGRYEMGGQKKIQLGAPVAMTPNRQQ